MQANYLVSASTDVKIWDLMSTTSDKNANETETSKAKPEKLLGVEVASFKQNDTSTAVNVARWSHDSAADIQPSTSVDISTSRSEPRDDRQSH